MRVRVGWWRRGGCEEGWWCEERKVRVWGYCEEWRVCGGGGVRREGCVCGGIVRSGGCVGVVV